MDPFDPQPFCFLQYPDPQNMQIHSLNFIVLFMIYDLIYDLPDLKSEWLQLEIQLKMSF